MNFRQPCILFCYLLPGKPSQSFPLRPGSPPRPAILLVQATVSPHKDFFETPWRCSILVCDIHTALVGGFWAQTKEKGFKTAGEESWFWAKPTTKVVWGVDSLGGASTDIEIGNMYPVTESHFDPATSLKGTAQKPGYQSHYAVTNR